MWSVVVLLISVSGRYLGKRSGRVYRGKRRRCCRWYCKRCCEGVCQQLIHAEVCRRLGVGGRCGAEKRAVGGGENGCGATYSRLRRALLTVGRRNRKPNGQRVSRERGEKGNGNVRKRESVAAADRIFHCSPGKLQKVLCLQMRNRPCSIAPSYGSSRSFRVFLRLPRVSLRHSCPIQPPSDQRSIAIDVCELWHAISMITKHETK